MGFKPTIEALIDAIQRKFARRPDRHLEELTDVELGGIIANLQYIGKMADYNRINHLMEFLYYPDPRITPHAVLAAEKILLRTDPRFITRIEHKVKSVSSGDPSLSDAKRLLVQYSETRIAALLSCSWNGYVREAALRRLIAIDEPWVLGFILLRVHDWVSQVRDVALKGVRAWMVPNRVSAFIDFLPLIGALEKRERAVATGFLDRIKRMLADPVYGVDYDAVTRSKSCFVRRQAFRLLLEFKVWPLREIVIRALRDKDVWVQGWLAYRVDELSDEDFRELVPKLLESRSNAVHLAVIRRAAKGEQDEARPILEREIFHHRHGVSEAAQFYLKRISDIDFAGTYRARLASAGPREAAACITGLGRHGSLDDIDTIIGFLGHEDQFVRAACISAIGRLDLEANARGLLKLGIDPKRQVRRSILKTLSSLEKWKLGELLADLAPNIDSPVHYADLWARLVLTLGHYDAMLMLLTAVYSVARPVVPTLVRALTIFQKISFNSMPVSDHLIRIAEAYSLAKPRLPEHMINELEPRINEHLRISLKQARDA